MNAIDADSDWRRRGGTREHCPTKIQAKTNYPPARALHLTCAQPSAKRNRSGTALRILLHSSYPVKVGLV
jgi:hypothetical protein